MAIDLHDAAHRRVLACTRGKNGADIGDTKRGYTGSNLGHGITGPVAPGQRKFDPIFPPRAARYT